MDLTRIVSGLVVAGALSAVALPAVATAQTPAAPAAMSAEQPLPFDPAVRVGKLPNGLTYYIRANSWPAQRAELRLAINAGSVLEDDSQQGLASPEWSWTAIQKDSP